MQKITKPKFGKSSFNTIALKGTGNTPKTGAKTKQTIAGAGADLSNKDSLYKKSQRKMISDKIALRLVDVAKKKGNVDLKKMLWNTYNCQKKATLADGRLYARYCKNKCCSICCGIRNVEIIRKYLPVIEAWEKPYFVTLTATAVSAKSLPRRMKDMNRGLRLILDRHKKKEYRGKGIKFVGIKSKISFFQKH